MNHIENRRRKEKHYTAVEIKFFDLFNEMGRITDPVKKASEEI